MEEKIRYLIDKLVAALKALPTPKRVMWSVDTVRESLHGSFSGIVENLKVSNPTHYETALSEFENIVDILNDIDDAMTRTRVWKEFQMLRGNMERISDDILDNLRDYMANKMAHECLKE